MEKIFKSCGQVKALCFQHLQRKRRSQKSPILPFHPPPSGGIIRRKNEIVRYNPETMNKLYLSVMPIESEKPDILSLVVEELWSPDLTDDNIMTTNFIHATYNLKTECIEHMDHSINEYSNLSRYRDKHIDTSARTGVPIDAYADKHYKIWCLKAPSMCLEDWYKITFASLDEPFRPLFDEMFEA